MPTKHDTTLALDSKRQRRHSLTVAHVDVASVSATPQPLAEAANFAKHLLAGAMSAVVSRQAMLTIKSLCAARPHLALSERVLPAEAVLHSERTGTALQVAEASLNLEGVSDVPRGKTRAILRQSASLKGSAELDGKSGCRTSCVPMERVKTHVMQHERTGTALQVAQGIYRKEGILGFWRGNSLNILRTAPFKAVNFFSFDMYRKAFTRLGKGNLSNEAHLTAGAMAGMTASLVCFPLDVLRTRVLSAPQSEVRSHPLRILVKIAKREGLAALYVGIGPSLVGMVPSGAIYYWMYDLLKERQFNLVAKRKDRRPEKLDTAHSLLFGAIAGCSAESLVFPLEVVRRRMQTLAAEGISQKGAMGIRQAVLDIWAKEKLRGFYAGMLPNTIQVLPSAALSYAAFEASKSLLRVKE